VGSRRTGRSRLAAFSSLWPLPPSDVALLEAYNAGLLAYTALRPFTRTGHGWWELVEDFAPWWYAPAPLLALLGRSVGSRTLQAGGLIGIAAFLARWGNRFVHRCPRPTATPTLRVMTYNVLAWNEAYAGIAASILRERPDIVAFQELSPEAALHLQSRLGAIFPYQALQALPNPSGAGLFSRYPLRDIEDFELSFASHWSQRVVVETPAGPIAFLNIHTSIPKPRLMRRGRWPIVRFSSDRRAGEIRRLVAMLDRIDGPVLVVGDLNMTERSVDYEILRSRLTDAFGAVGRGFGFTFPNVGHLPRLVPIPWPVLRIDYVWHSAHLVPVAAHLGDPGGSDHRPVVADFVRRT
jgi:vancomycin resistance protein VanJ